MIEIISIVLFAGLVLLVFGRAVMLRKRGIKVLVFGVTNKSDFLLMPIVAFLVYSILSCIFGFPFFNILKSVFFESNIIRFAGALLCASSLVWFGFALKSFGDSFRVGIDEKQPDKLVTAGMFGISRNPVYVAFIAFLFGMLCMYPNLSVFLGAAALFSALHRQILREEKFLRGHYGEEYKAYCIRVRRYL